MSDDRRLGEAVDDACPFPPGSEVPQKKKGLAEMILSFYDDFFGNWKIILSVITAASLVLAYSLLAVPPPLVSLPSEPDAWSRPIPEFSYTWVKVTEWVPRFETQIVHDGDLILEGDDILVIENCIYVLNGELLVKDNARLILRNAELSVKLKTGWHWQLDLLPSPFVILFNNSARFEAYNSSIFYPEHGLGIGFLQFSEAIVEASNVSRTIIYGDDESTIHVSDSSIGDLIVTKNAICEVINSDIASISSQLKYHFHMRGQWDNCRVEVWNSTVKDVYIELKNCTNAKVSSPFSGFHRFWNSYNDLNVDGSAFNLTLHDTNVKGKLSLASLSGSLKVLNRNDLSRVDVWNGSLLVSNSSMPALSCEEGSVTEAEESVFWGLLIRDDADVSISRSKTGKIYLNHFKGTAIFDNVLINQVFSSEYCECYIGGSIRFGENASAQKIHWAYGVVTRNFEVQTHREERGLPHVNLILYDQENTPIWSGETDRDGKASFNISFCKNWQLNEPYKYVTNYEDLWTLEAEKGEASINVTVGFLSDTPIVLAFPPIPKPPFWMQRWFLSAVSSSIIMGMVAFLLVRYLKKR